MSEIDWDKAPEGATHYMAESSTDYECWLKKQGDKWFYMRMNGQAWMKATIDDDSLRTITERPSPAWSGDGLPPIGVVCEANFVGEWTRFEMRYYGEAYVVFKTAFEVQRTRHDFDTCGVKFRPFRTPEQIAADEREAAIKAACLAVEDKIEKYNTRLDCSVAIRAIIEAMIDAGYKKP